VIACTCGSTASHVVARRGTADCVRVELHSNGAITGRMGFGLEGIAIVRPRTEKAQRAALAAGWMFAGEVELYDADEIGALYKACQWAAARGLGIEGARARLRTEAPLRLVWTVISADRDGNVKVRCCRLDRMRWPGLGVWNDSRGYHVARIIGGDTLDMNGGYMTLATIRELSIYLRSVQVLS
jgi:hypothetical protein